MLTALSDCPSTSTNAYEDHTETSSISTCTALVCVCLWRNVRKLYKYAYRIYIHIYICPRRGKASLPQHPFMIYTVQCILLVYATCRCSPSDSLPYFLGEKIVNTVRIRTRVEIFSPIFSRIYADVTTVGSICPVSNFQSSAKSNEMHETKSFHEMLIFCTHIIKIFDPYFINLWTKVEYIVIYIV
jgi:hypothetical protein